MRHPGAKPLLERRISGGQDGYSHLPHRPQSPRPGSREARPGGGPATSANPQVPGPPQGQGAPNAPPPPQPVMAARRQARKDFRDKNCTAERRLPAQKRIRRLPGLRLPLRVWRAAVPAGWPMVPRTLPGPGLPQRSRGHAARPGHGSPPARATQVPRPGRRRAARPGWLKPRWTRKSQCLLRPPRRTLARCISTRSSGGSALFPFVSDGS